MARNYYICRILVASIFRLDWIAEANRHVSLRFGFSIRVCNAMLCVCSRRNSLLSRQLTQPWSAGNLASVPVFRAQDSHAEESPPSSFRIVSDAVSAAVVPPDCPPVCVMGRQRIEERSAGSLATTHAASTSQPPPLSQSAILGDKDRGVCDSAPSSTLTESEASPCCLSHLLSTG